MRSFVKLLLPLSLIPFLLYCSNLQTQKVWQSPSFTKKQLSKVLVIGASVSQVNRMVFEQTFSKYLAQQGINAIASNEAIGDDYTNRESIKNYARKNNIRYILVAYQSNQEIKKETVYSETTVYDNGSLMPVNNPNMAYDFPYTDNFWAPTTFVTVGQPQEVERVKSTLMVRLFNVSTGQKVFSIETLITNPDSLSEVSQQLAKALLKHMK